MTTSTRTRRVSKAKTSPTPAPDVKIVQVTPQLAAQWLKKNTGNRKISSPQLARYVEDMENGRWSFDGSPIQFDSKGKLINGQHRLNAVIASDTTQTFAVVVNIDPGAARTIDVGKSRTLSDQLTIDGYKYASNVGATATTCVVWIEKLFTNNLRSTASPAKIRNFLEANKALLVKATEDTFQLATTGSRPLTQSVMGAFLFQAVQAGVSYADALNFLRELHAFQTNGAGDPRAALLNRVANLKQTRTPLSQPEAISLLVRAWNAYRKGEKMSKLQVRGPKGNAIPIPDIAV